MKKITEFDASKYVAPKSTKSIRNQYKSTNDKLKDFKDVRQKTPLG